jgi:hypothetical protein
VVCACVFLCSCVVLCLWAARGAPIEMDASSPTTACGARTARARGTAGTGSTLVVSHEQERAAREIQIQNILVTQEEGTRNQLLLLGDGTRHEPAHTRVPPIRQRGASRAQKLQSRGLTVANPQEKI